MREESRHNITKYKRVTIWIFKKKKERRRKRNKYSCKGYLLNRL